MVTTIQQHKLVQQQQLQQQIVTTVAIIVRTWSLIKPFMFGIMDHPTFFISFVHTTLVMTTSSSTTT
jgi:hypothetical protein